MLLDIANYLLSQPIDASDRDLCGVTPLHWAAVNGHMGCCKTLLEHGAKINSMVYDVDVRYICFVQVYLTEC